MVQPVMELEAWKNWHSGSWLCPVKFTLPGYPLTWCEALCYITEQIVLGA